MSDPTTAPTPPAADLPEWVEVYSIATGEKLAPVPRHFIGHPVLGRGLSLTPTAKARLAVPVPPPTPPSSPPAIATGDNPKTTTSKEK